MCQRARGTVKDREGLGKANLRLLEHPEERGRIYLVWMDLANDSLVDWIKGVASSR